MSTTGQLTTADSANWAEAKFAFPFTFYSEEDLAATKKNFVEDLSQEGLTENVDYVVSNLTADAIYVKFADEGRASFYLMFWLEGLNTFEQKQ